MNRFAKLFFCFSLFFFATKELIAKNILPDFIAKIAEEKFLCLLRIDKSYSTWVTTKLRANGFGTIFLGNITLVTRSDVCRKRRFAP